MPLEQPLQWRTEPNHSDIGAVRDLAESSGFFNPEEIAIAAELVEERLSRGLASGYEFLFAETADRLLGYTCYGHIAGTRSSYDLYWIVVAPQQQGQGLGRTLLARSEHLIQVGGGTRVYIETSARELYAPTQGFYRRCGYRQEALLKDFYGPDDDKLIYCKVLY